MLVAGAYDPSYFESWPTSSPDVVKRSRARLEPAETGLRRGPGPRPADEPGRPRLADSRRPLGPGLPAAGLRTDTPPLAILVVFGAHATVSHPIPPRLGGDYPAALASELKRRTGARSVLFASGAVGDASPSRPKAASQAKSAEALGSALADDLMAALPSARFDRDVEVGNLRLDVDLPPVRLPFFTRWLRFSPLADLVDRRPPDAPARAPPRPGGPGRVPWRLLGPPGRPPRRLDPSRSAWRASPPASTATSGATSSPRLGLPRGILAMRPDG